MVEYWADDQRLLQLTEIKSSCTRSVLHTWSSFVATTEFFDLSYKTKPKILLIYNKSASLSALRTYNAVSWPGGAAISLYALASPLVLCNLGLCIVNVHWYRNSDRFLTIFTFGIRSVGSFMEISPIITEFRHVLEAESSSPGRCRNIHNTTAQFPRWLQMWPGMAFNAEKERWRKRKFERVSHNVSNYQKYECVYMWTQIFIVW